MAQLAPSTILKSIGGKRKELIEINTLHHHHGEWDRLSQSNGISMMCSLTDLIVCRFYFRLSSYHFKVYVCVCCE